MARPTVESGDEGPAGDETQGRVDAAFTWLDLLLLPFDMLILAVRAAGALIWGAITALFEAS